MIAPGVAATVGTKGRRFRKCKLLCVSAAAVGTCKVMRASAWDFDEIYFIIFNNLLGEQ